MSNSSYGLKVFYSAPSFFSLIKEKQKSPYESFSAYKKVSQRLFSTLSFHQQTSHSSLTSTLSLK